jgi:D-lactate dehydrogenase
MAIPIKIFAYSCRKDEATFFEQFGVRYGIDLAVTNEAPLTETLRLCRGYPCISIITTLLDFNALKIFYDQGVRFISTRSIGYDHIDADAVRKLGIRIGNVSYSPDTVANYTIMFMLMCIRNIKTISRLTAAQDFSLQGGVRGRELRNLTVGIAGTGRIGRRVIEMLRGFHCPILAYDKYENPDLASLVRYVRWEELIAESDIVSLHMPASAENFHIVNAESFDRMKDGVVIVNTARGSLIDTPALVDAIESRKVGAAALDVIEDEGDMYYNNLRGEILKNRWIGILRAFPNVILTPHTAFYTDQAVSDMVENSLKSCAAFQRSEENPWEVRL